VRLRGESREVFRNSGEGWVLARRDYGTSQLGHEEEQMRTWRATRMAGLRCWRGGVADRESEGKREELSAG
jgi:hypothetical protein